MKNDFFVHLSSVDSFLHYPFNSSKCFSNLLSSKIDISDGSYEVALASIIYEKKEVIPVKKVPTLAINTKIMINYPSRSKSSFEVNILLGEKHVINMLNKTLEHLRFAHIDYEEDEEKHLKAVLRVFLPYEGKFLLDDNLKSLLGFQKNRFDNGTYKAEHYINLETLGSIKTPLTFTSIKFVNIFATIPSLWDPSLDGIAEALNNAFENVHVDIIAKVDQAEDFLDFKFEDDLVSFYLPLSLSNFFEVDPEAVYSQFNARVNLTALKKGEANNHILCLTNIVDLQHYGSQMFPILRILPAVDSIKGVVSQHFQPLFYVPVNVKELVNIQIEFYRTNSQPLPIDTSPVTVTLHFRKQS